MANCGISCKVIIRLGHIILTVSNVVSCVFHQVDITPKGAEGGEQYEDEEEDPDEEDEEEE